MRTAFLLLLCVLCLEAQQFDVVSFKHTANMMDGSVIRDGKRYYRTGRKLEFTGSRLSGEQILPVYFQFAFSPLVSPWRLDEQQKGINDEFYEIDARAPAGTTIDEARAMMRTVLVSRLGLVYHLSEKSTPIYALLHGPGHSQAETCNWSGTESWKDADGRVQTEVSNGCRLCRCSFERWRAVLVLDKTGTQGQDSNSMWIGARSGVESHDDPAIVLTEVKRMGLKLEPRNEPVRILVIDHVNKMPTPN